MASLSDAELKAKLTELGHPPGPITATTRALYLHKLKQISKNLSVKVSHTSTPASAAEKPAAPASTPVYVPRGGTERPRTPPLEEDTAPPPQSLQAVADDVSSSGAAVIAANLLATLGDSAHPGNDTAVVFGDGSVLFASRAILSSQCPRLTTLLFSSEEPFDITVVTLTGRNSQFRVRYNEYVADLKERLALTQGIPSEEQRLVYQNNELVDTVTIGDSGIQSGATIHLVLINTVEPRPPPLVLPSHTPWLSFAHLRVELGLERFQHLNSVQAATQPTILPRHTSHILHIYDVPRDGFLLFVRLLYTGQVDSDGDLGSLVVVYVLCVYFDLSLLAEKCLSLIRGGLTVALATELLTYAVSVQCQSLKDLCASVISGNS